MPVTITIDNIPITFPFEPYDVQKDYMTKVIECLQKGSHGMLESPTGTGKTLSLLCSTLAWLITKVGEDDLKRQTDNEKPVVDDGDLVGMQEKHTKSKRPQIIYSSRTHPQVTQAIAELRRTHYAYVNAAVLGSREHLCIHSEVSNEANPGVKVSKCRALVKRKGCLYQLNVERTKNEPVYHEEILDIEDLVKVGRKLGNCPYYMTKELRARADIIFMPYQYLLDICTRKRMEINLENCVVIFDEGHNVEKMCEESASFELSWSDISVCIEELTEIIEALPKIEQYATEPPPFTGNDLVYLRKVMRLLQTSVDEIKFQHADSSSKFNGHYIFQLLEKSQITHLNFVILDNLITKVNDWINNSEGAPLQHIGVGLSRFQNFLQIVFYMDKCTFEEHRKRVADSYKVYVTLESKSRDKPDSRYIKKDDKSVKKDAKIVHFWCFNPAFGMQALLKEGARSIIITSGTLSPLQPLISELGIPIDVTLESGHVISKEQVYVGVIGAGPDKYALNSSFKTRDDPNYVQSLGRTILNVSRLIPHGLLVFFPSYAVMEKCQRFWISNGLWGTMNQSKEICVEPRNKGELREVMNRYYAKNGEPGSKGAIFMAVCRGKVSEGLDFVDHNGRGVIITGLPFPPCFDPRVVMKREYLDENKKRIRGYDWYQLEATRAVNQAIGRVIRHKNDYGVILFCDARFSGAGIRKQLSCWLRDQVNIHDSFPSLPRPIALFFKYAKETLPQSEIKPLKVESLDDSDDDDIVVLTDASSKHPYDSPSKYSSYDHKYPRRIIHQYQENYLHSKVAWWNKRHNYGRPAQSGRRNHVETISSPSFSDTGNEDLISQPVPYSYEDMPTQPVLACYSSENDSTGTVGFSALSDSSVTTNCPDKPDVKVTNKALSKIVSRPGNARGGKVYVKVPTTESASCAGNCEKDKSCENKPSRTPPTPYSRNYRGERTYAVTSRSTNNYGKAIKSKSTVVSVNCPTPAVSSSVFAETANVGVLYVDAQGNPVAPGNSHLLDVGRNGPVHVQNAVVAGAAATNVIALSANESAIHYDQLAVAIPNQTDPSVGGVQYYLVNPGTSGTSALFLNNQYVLLDPNVQYVITDPQMQSKS